MAKSRRVDWDREQTLLVMNLYCRLPFGKQDARNPEVIELARALGRTANSVAMKLNNLTSLDPDEQARGVKGLAGASKLDRQVWDEFQRDWDALSIESETLWESRVAKRPPVEEPPQPVGEAGRADEAERVVRVRLTQRFFRNAVLASYDERCCITGNPIPALLEAAHILGWSASPGNRVNPRNGLCLSRLHHAAFDDGLITLDEKYRLVVSRELRGYLPHSTLEAEFIAFEGQAIRMPDKFPPEPAHLAQHRAERFKG